MIWRGQMASGGFGHRLLLFALLLSAALVEPASASLDPGLAEATEGQEREPRTSESDYEPRNVADNEKIDDDSVLAVEEIIPVAEISEIIPSREALGVWEIVGRLHPALVHFPIAWLMLLIFVDVGSIVWGRNGEWRRAGVVLGVLVLASFVPAMVTGLLRAAQLTHEEGGLIYWHRNLNFAAMTTVGLALALRLWKRQQLAGWASVVYLLLMLLSAVLVIVSGHLGAKMVYGENYLPF